MRWMGAALAGLMALGPMNEAQAGDFSFGIGGRWNTIYESWYSYWDYGWGYNLDYPAPMMCGGGEAFFGMGIFRIGGEGEWCGDLSSRYDQTQWTAGGNLGVNLPHETAFSSVRLGIGGGNYQNYSFNRWERRFWYMKPTYGYNMPFGPVNVEIGVAIGFNFPGHQTIDGPQVSGATLYNGSLYLTIYFGSFSDLTIMGKRRKAAIEHARRQQQGGASNNNNVAAPPPQAPPPPPTQAPPPPPPSSGNNNGGTPLAIPAGSSPPVTGNSNQSQAKVMVPAGTPLLVRFQQTLDGVTTQPGARYAVILEGNVVTSDGRILAHAPRTCEKKSFESPFLPTGQNISLQRCLRPRNAERDLLLLLRCEHVVTSSRRYVVTSPGPRCSRSSSNLRTKLPSLTRHLPVSVFAVNKKSEDDDRHRYDERQWRSGRERRPHRRGTRRR